MLKLGGREWQVSLHLTKLVEQVKNQWRIQDFLLGQTTRWGGAPTSDAVAFQQKRMQKGKKIEYLWGGAPLIRQNENSICITPFHIQMINAKTYLANVTIL